MGISLSILISMGQQSGLTGLIQQLGWIPSFNKITIDWTMGLFLNTDAKQPNTPPFFLFNIDEASYRDWGEPASTPRDKLLKLIKIAVTGQAQIIFVDIDLGYSEYPNNPQLSPSDQNLFTYLNEYETHCGTNCPHLLLVRNTRVHLSEQGLVRVNRYPEQRNSFLDSAVAKSPYLHWVSVGFYLDEDNTLRRWRLWEAACKPVTVLPSVQLLTVALLKEKQMGVQRIEQALMPYLPQDCESNLIIFLQTHPEVQNLRIELGAEKMLLHLTPSVLDSSIVYTMPEKLTKGTRRAQTLEGKPIFEAKAVRDILENPIDDTAAINLVQNKVVAIGGSYSDGHDIYHTPVGNMSGVLIILNAINSLLQYGELTKPPLWQVLLTEAVAIFLLSIVFARFSSFWGMALAGCFFIFILLPLTFYLFQYGIWLETAIPIIIMQLYRMSKDFVRKTE